MAKPAVKARENGRGSLFFSFGLACCCQKPVAPRNGPSFNACLHWPYSCHWWPAADRRPAEPAHSTAAPAKPRPMTPGQLCRGDSQADWRSRVYAAGSAAVALDVFHRQGPFRIDAAVSHGCLHRFCRRQSVRDSSSSGKQRRMLPADSGFLRPRRPVATVSFTSRYRRRLLLRRCPLGQNEMDASNRRGNRLQANFYRDYVIFGSQDNSLTCLKADTGEPVWKYESDDQSTLLSHGVGRSRSWPAATSNWRSSTCEMGKRHRKSALIRQPAAPCPARRCGRCRHRGKRIRRLTRSLARSCGVIGTRQIRLHFALQRPLLRGQSSSFCKKLVHALDPKTGRQLWFFTTKGRVDSSPVVVGDRLFVGLPTDAFTSWTCSRQGALAIRRRCGDSRLARGGRRPAGDWHGGWECVLLRQKVGWAERASSTNSPH